MKTTADIYDQYTDAVHVVQPSLNHYGQIRSFGGQIVTVKVFEDNVLVRQTLSQNGQGKVLVVDGGGSLRCGLLGDIIAQLAIDQCWAGVIIYGAIRDSATLKNMPIGIMALGTNPSKSAKRAEGQLNVPIHFHDVTFQPDHWLVADDDGIIVCQHKPY